MKTNNNITHFVFYFLVLILTGCNGLTSARLGCKSFEAAQVVHTNQDKVPAYTQTQQMPLAPQSGNNGNDGFISFVKNSPLLIFVKKSCLSKLEGDLVKSLLAYFFDCHFPSSRSTPDCLFDYTHQKLADSLYGLFRDALTASCKKQLAHFRGFVYRCFVDPDFLNSLTEPYEVAYKAPNAGAGMHKHLDFMVLLGCVKDMYVASFESYTASLLRDVLIHALIHMLGMSADSMIVYYIPRFIGKDFCKQIVRECSKVVCAYCSGPDFRRHLMMVRKATSKRWHAAGNIGRSVIGVAGSCVEKASGISVFSNGASLVASVADHAFSNISPDAIHSRSSIGNVTQQICDNIYNAIIYATSTSYVTYSINHVKDILKYMHG
ncbi:hypothetical protein [Cardinium endosymbiont of Philonthus spinipes]|uniref:hypothetical protein n=1 Tax=Cardinium endosymbiont of Philonthus spinipes TaxID=3077941 RepID=UPI00313D58C8